MTDEMLTGLQPGEILETAMLSPCVGGLVRTWTDAESRLWSVPDPTSLQSYLGRGLIARTLREEKEQPRLDAQGYKIGNQGAEGLR